MLLFVNIGASAIIDAQEVAHLQPIEWTLAMHVDTLVLTLMLASLASLTMLSLFK